jgi:hypothetical protein
MKLKKFHTIVDNTPQEVKEEIKLSMDILERMNELLDQKFEGKQKFLAEKLNKSEAEVSKWFSGVQNFTTRTIAKLQAAFGEPIIAVCSGNDNATFVLVKVPFNKEKATLQIKSDGCLQETKVEYKNLRSAESSSPSKTLPSLT